MANDRSAGTNILVVGGSVILIAALMGWLVVQGQNRNQATVAEGDTTTAAETPTGAPPAQVVSDTAFEQNVKNYVGQIIEITNAKFSSGLSTQTFWIELPTGAPYLVKLNDAMVAGGTALPTGGTLNIVGTVQNKDAALVGQWMQAGVIQNDDQRMQAEFGTTYIEARQIRPAGQ